MDLVISRILIDLKALALLSAILFLAVAALAALCVHLQKRLGRMEFALLQLRVYTSWELDDMKAKMDLISRRLASSFEQMDAEVDEILAEPLPEPPFPPVPPELESIVVWPPAGATITPIGRGAEIRKASTRPAGKPPRRLLSELPQRRLERPGLRPQEQRGPFSGKPTANPFEDP